ncbi:SDR family NAD(P)-dependent oxidoreductase [Nocardia sp. CDC160]|uniref:SDR family NAD(P)-dependent oxidoreductase n=1 Tax=Nocardia sp. CDC160 TaxID=3112166 RepID=UPI002DB9D38A|nr:SDR family NAD(P)-dependent oxidoreductase [Nocardia sp. CDC160]MEC3914627.1 SDR family NAD(P)-dependent oxidoreductase [Nocardia sp. CDC160]
MTGFDNDVVVVTGAGGGIGRAVAQRFARKRAIVIVADLDKERAVRTAESIEEFGGDATPFAVDVADAVAMESFAEDVQTEFGAAKVLVNTAGYTTAGPFLEHTLDEWDRLMGVNVWGLVHGCTHFGRQMIESGRGGRIITVTSVAAYTPIPMSSAYCATAAAAHMLTEGLRLEFAGTGVAVTAVCPDRAGAHGPEDIARTIVRAAARRRRAVVARIDDYLAKKLERFEAR